MRSGPGPLVYAAAAVLLAPIIIFAKPHSGRDVAYLVPLGCFPLPALLAERWPSPWSSATVAGFAALLGLGWIVVRGSGADAWWRGVLPLAGLSLAGSALVVGSFVLLGSGLIALIWTGLAAALWNLVLLLQTRGLGPGLLLLLLDLWLVGGIVLGLYGALFGVMTGLCC